MLINKGGDMIPRGAATARHAVTAPRGYTIWKTKFLKQHRKLVAWFRLHTKLVYLRFYRLFIRKYQL